MRGCRTNTLFLFSLLLILFGLYLSAFPYISVADYPDGYYETGYIIDGDTFVLRDGKRVQLIGINSPEIGELCYEEARQRLSSLISGKNVFLEKDISETDGFDSLLRYVYVDGLFVNYILVYEGYAWAVTHPPDLKYASQIANAEDSANSNNRGCLWKGQNALLTYDDSKFHMQMGCFISILPY